MTTYVSRPRALSIDQSRSAHLISTFLMRRLQLR